MFEKLIANNDDLRRLLERGYAIAFDSNCLVVRDIPYLDDKKQLRWGVIVTKLVFIDEVTVTQDDHQIFFTGTVPHNIDGTSIPNLGGGPTNLPLSSECSDIVVQRSFSNKPKTSGKFQDFFEKIDSYMTIISGPAMELYGANPYTYRAVKKFETDSIFKFADTLTTRAEVSDLSASFKDDIIAIIGLGGTGAYILDFIVKTRVKEIRIFDADDFHVHNAFRSPGKLDSAELGKKKAEIYHTRYDNFRTGITFSAKHVSASCANDLAGVTFAFVCVDKGASRAEIFDLLISEKIPFIDVGMGLKRREDKLNGLLRTTYFPVGKGEEIRAKGLAELQDRTNNVLYKTNIQISELNALNAALAVIKFKQVRGFYFDENPQYHLLFEVGDSKIASNYEDD